MKGVFYFRIGLFGGCILYNVMVVVYFYEFDFNYISIFMGDSLWWFDNMCKYFVWMERKQYINGFYKGYGRDGWFIIEVVFLIIFFKDF